MHRASRATLVVLLFAAASSPAAAAPRVRMWQTRDADVTEGYVDVQATVEQIYAALTDYAHWPSLFSDIEWVRQKSGGRDNARLECKSRTYGKKSQHFVFRNRSGKLVSYYMDDGPPGVRLWQQITFEPDGDSGLVRVRIRMHISVNGVLGWLTSAKNVRKYRERKVRRDLVDLGKRWEPKPKPSADGG